MRNTMIFPVGKKKKKKIIVSLAVLPLVCVSSSNGSVLSNYYHLKSIFTNTKKSGKRNQSKREPNEQANPRRVLAQWCPTRRYPVGSSPPGLSVHGIFQTRILEWLQFAPPWAIPSPEIEPASPETPALAGRFAITEPPEKPKHQVGTRKN